MYSYHRGGLARGNMLLAVIQTLLLLSALVVAPATAIAQDPDASTAPAAEATSEPAVEPTPQPKAEAPKAEAKPKAQGAAPKAHEPKAEPQADAPKADPEPARKTLSEQGLTIRTFPQKIDVALGGKVIVSAWLCPAGDKTPFGGQLAGDGKPGTKDDDCEPVRVDWSLADDTGARLSNGVGYKTRLTLMAEAGNRLVAKVDDLKRNTKVTVKAQPAKVRPEADEVLAEIKEAVSQPRGVQQPTKAAPTAAAIKTGATKAPADEPAVGPSVLPSEAPADEPTATPSEIPADEPTAEPSEAPADEPAVGPSVLPSEAPADEPTADPSEAPADEPVADPSATPSEAPADEPTADPSEAPADEPVADPSATPSEAPGDEPTADPSEAPADEPVADPSATPSEIPADEPTADPSEAPAAEPVADPSEAPIDEPLPSSAPPAALSTRSTDTGTSLAITPAAAGDPGEDGSANLDQCANGGVGEPPTGCDGAVDWVNGNLGQSKASYVEGETIPYRMRLGDLTTGGEIHALTIEWDTTKSGLHALDYITSFDETETTANPCVGAPCSGSVDDTIAIPADPQVTGAGITPIPGVFSIWGGEFTSISGYSYSNGSGFSGDKKASITVYFTASQADPVIAWGGHIASRIDWGIGMAAGTIPGSPYHMRLITINDKGGNQDRSLAAAAVYLLNRLTVVKEATPADDTEFAFSANGSFMPTSFGLQDGESQVFGPYSQNTSGSVAESNAPGWDLTFGHPACTVLDANGGSQTVNGRAIDISLKEGELVTCTFYNEQQDGTLVVRKEVVNDDGGAATAGDFQFSLSPDPSGLSPITFEQGNHPDHVGDDEYGQNALTLLSGTYTVTESLVEPGYTASYAGCANVALGAGQTKICTITNDDDAPSLQLVKSVDAGDTGAADDADDWTLTATAAAPDDGRNISTPGGSHVAEDVFANVAYTLGEAGPDGYSASAWDCTAGELEGSVLTLGLGEDAICTIVNTASPATLTLVKNVVGGDATTADFQGMIDGNDVPWGVPQAVTVGAHTASESWSVDDYAAGVWSGDCDAQGNVSVVLGQDAECTITNYYAGLTIEKTADPDFYAEVGDVIEYTITATNTGSATLDGVDVTDEFPAGLDDFTCTLDGAGDPIALPYDGLAPGEAIECTASHTITGVDIEAGSVFNQACADADQISTEVCDDTTVYLSELEITKTADVDYFTADGDEIGYTVTATNVGEATLTNVDISDELVDGLASWSCVPGNPVASLAVGESIVCEATYTVTEADVEAGSVLNAACADSDQTAEVCADVTTPLAALEIVKAASPDTYSAVGDEIVYTVTATNSGEATLNDVDISDALIDGLDSWTCQVGDTAVALPVAELLSGQAITCQATYLITEADVTGSEPEGSVLNTACAVSDQTTEVCADVTVHEIVVELDKSVTPTVMAEPGGLFTYTLVIDNESVVPVTITELIDDNSSLSADWAANCAVLVGTVLAPDGPGEDDQVECTYTVERTVAGVYENTATVTVTDANGTEATACDEVKVKVLSSQLEIVKEADVAYFTAAGDEIGYTVTATNVGQATLTNVDITDELIDGLDSWTCDPGNPVASLAPGATIVCEATYTVTDADVEAGEVLNTACADSDQVGPVCDDVDVPLAALEIVKSADSAVFGAVGDEIVYTITATNVGQAILTDVDITDELIDGLDSWTCDPGNPVASLAVGASIVCEATYVITEADFEAGEVLNTACAASGETDVLCDEVTVHGIDVTIEKTPDQQVVESGDKVTFTLVFSHTTPADVSTITAFALKDDVYGDLFDAGNTAVTDNTCLSYAGQVLVPDTDYECSFKAKVFGTPAAPHVNVATIVVAGDGREAEASDDAVVGFIAVLSSPTPRPTESLKPTDMLLTTDTQGPVDDGDVLGGLLNWSVWLLLSVLLILATAWIIRRERLAEERIR